MSPSLLHAFRHPLILLSIVGLLLNDHLLKALVPSWATGKISDFAGLFFFPFLIGFFLQAWKPKPISSRHALLAGFILTGTIFAGIKTLPAVNGMALDLFLRLFGYQTTIARDVTDCIALLVFFPAWMMWQGIERGIGITTPGKVPYLVLAAGSLAALATSPCMPAQQVTRLAFDGETLYAGLGSLDESNFGEYGGTILASSGVSEDWQVVMYSENSGSVWRTVPGYEAIAKNPFLEPMMFPKTVCDPLEPKRCYRIDGTARIDESRDRGTSWKAAWQPPANREDFRRRLAEGEITDCGKIPNVLPYDLALIPGETGSTLIVAMGNEGLMVHPAEGDWLAKGVNTPDSWQARINPTPFTVRGLDNAIDVTIVELLLVLTAALMVWFSFDMWIRESILLWVETPTIERVNRIKLPAKIAFLWTLLIPGAIIYLTPRNAAMLISVLFLPYWIIFAALVVWHIRSFPENIPSKLQKVEWFGFISGLIVFITSWLPFGLWAYGAINSYILAIIISVASGLAAITGCVEWIKRQMDRTENRVGEL